MLTFANGMVTQLQNQQILSILEGTTIYRFAVRLLIVSPIL